MRKILKVNLYFLILLIIEILGPYALSPIYQILGITDIKLLLFFNHVILLLIPAIIYLLITKASFKETLKLNKLHWKDILLVILLGFVVQPVMSFFSLISSFFFNNEVGSLILDMMSAPYIVLIALIALMPCITEEITLRGIVLSGYDNKNKYIAAAITGLLFGIFHLNEQQFLYATVIGFVLSLVVRITNSIYSSMIIHFIINGSSVTLAKLSQKIMDILPIATDSTEFTLRNIGVGEKILLLGTYGTIAIIFSAFVFLIIYALERLNIKRNLGKENSYTKKYSNTNIDNERILNIPFVLIITLYLVFMFISITNG